MSGSTRWQGITIAEIDGVVIGGSTPAAITGTTIDATTDFTVGNTVITDGVLTDPGGFSIVDTLNIGVDNTTLGTLNMYPTTSAGGSIVLHVPSGQEDLYTDWTIKLDSDPSQSAQKENFIIKNNGGAMLIMGSAGVVIPQYVLTVGIAAGAQSAQVNLRGSSGNGGSNLYMHLGDTADTNIAHFGILVDNDDLLIGPDTDTDAFKLVGNGAAVTAEFTVGLTGTTIGASVLGLLERSSDPTQPPEGESVIWMSDGTGKGDDGDVMVASTASGVTKFGTLFDHSAGAGW